MAADVIQRRVGAAAVTPVGAVDTPEAVVGTLAEAVVVDIPVVEEADILVVADTAVAIAKKLRDVSL